MIRVLGPGDLSAFLRLCAADPVVNVFAESRARLTRLEPRWLGGEMLGWFPEAGPEAGGVGELAGALHLAVNVVPVGDDPAMLAAVAERVRARAATWTTVSGPHEAVRTLWGHVAPSLGEPRELRWHQRHLEWTAPPEVAPDARVRLARRDDLDAVYPQAVAMYTEEVGESPEKAGGAALYRTRLVQLISKGHTFIRVEDGRVVFKADVAYHSPSAAQIQGVYVPPDLRGQGRAGAGMVAVAQAVAARVAPRVSLYVNDWNTGALRAYHRAGFRQTAEFATVMR